MSHSGGLGEARSSRVGEALSRNALSGDERRREGRRGEERRGGEPWSSIGVKAAALGTPPAVGGGTLVPASPFGGPSQKVGVLLTL